MSLHIYLEFILCYTIERKDLLKLYLYTGEQTMQVIRQITNDITYVGASDRRLSLFENIFPLPRGVSYNSYIINDEKTALIDAVDYDSSRVFVENVKAALNGKTLDYIVVNHMEPDHAGSLRLICDLYPDAALVATKKAVDMMAQFFGDELKNEKIVVKEGDTVSLGKHELSFYTAPMVHWPEVMVTYESFEKVLFSADAFGTFGALNGNIFNDEYDIDRDWLPDYRRYYTNICGKYGMQVQSLLKKALTLDIQMICPLHGPVWRSNLVYIINKYDIWSKYEAEGNSVMIAYASIYGNTENAAYYLANELSKLGVKDIAMYDVSSTDMSYLISETFRCSHIVLMSATYNLEIYPKMDDYISDMKRLNVSNKTFAIVDNGTWAPTAGKKMREAVETLKNCKLCENTTTVKSSVNESNAAVLSSLAQEIAAGIQG